MCIQVDRIVTAIQQKCVKCPSLISDLCNACYRFHNLCNNCVDLYVLNIIAGDFKCCRHQPRCGCVCSAILDGYEEIASQCPVENHDHDCICRSPDNGDYGEPYSCRSVIHRCVCDHQITLCRASFHCRV